MSEEEVIRFCLKHSIKIEQYYFMWMVLNKEFWRLPYNKSPSRQYLSDIAVFKQVDIDDLITRGLVMDMNKPGHSNPEFYIVSDEISKEIFVDEDMAEEMWDLYPPTFPLSNGGMFIAQAGGDKNDLLATYRKKIKNSPKKHAFVMKQLTRYIALVRSGKINGYKISDWIGQELWITVSKIQEEGGSFVKDI